MQDHLAQLLVKLGLPWEASDPMLLYPGPKRFDLLRAALSKACCGAGLEGVLQKHGPALDATTRGLPEAERSAHVYHAVLQTLGLPCTPEQILGSGDAPSRLAFLCQLLGLLDAQQRCFQALNAAAGATSVTATPEARLLDFACSRLDALVEERVQLFPRDLQTHLSEQEQPALGCAELETAVSSGRAALAQLQQEAQRLEPLAQCSGDSDNNNDEDNDYAAALRQSQLQEALQAFCTASKSFNTLYDSSLSQACRYLSSGAQQQEGQGQQLGLGASSAALLGSYAQLLHLLSQVKTIYDVHGALTQSSGCSGPLQGVQQQQLQDIVQYGRQRIQVIRQQATVLQNAVKGG